MVEQWKCKIAPLEITQKIGWESSFKGTTETLCEPSLMAVEIDILVSQRDLYGLDSNPY